MVARTRFYLQAALRSPSTTNDEGLGVSTIAGLRVHGYRHSTTITSTTEYWFSEKLQMNVMTEQTGSRGQTRSVTLTQVSLNEPAAELFQIPREYTASLEPFVLPEGTNPQQPKNIIYVAPIYPPLARSARVQGTVEFVATIGPDGAVKELELVRGHPLLAKAAREAVLEWIYEPTLRNGKAVSAKTDIILNFAL
jgi:TonB family protein